jgi:putative DNA primase/helicase
MDKLLEGKLLNELSGILNWAIEGCLKWQKSELNEPDVIKNAVKAYRYSQDIVTYFLNEIVERKSNSRISKDDLYQTFVSFCENNDEESISKIAFGKRLKELKFIETKSGSTRYWNNISIRDDNT